MKNNKNNKSVRRKRNVSSKNTRKNNSDIKDKQQIVCYMLQMLMTVKLYHWNTISYASHKATDDLYTRLNTLIDQFVEILLGKNNKGKNIILDTKSLFLKSFKDNKSFEKEIEEYKKYMMNLSEKFNQKENSDLLNIRDEILSELNKISYLLTLK
jgi:DNA-binding ferritin-like protein